MKIMVKKAFLLFLLCVVSIALMNGCQKTETPSATIGFTDRVTEIKSTPTLEEPTPTEEPAVTEVPTSTEVPAATEEPTPTEAPVVTEEAPATEAPELPEEALTPEFYFSTTDRDGNPVTQEIFRESKLTMLNFWESWCGPCVGEMPELERLQQDYADRGFRLYGITSSASDEADVEDVIQYTGVTYTMLRYCAEFDPFQTGYVPTTVFVDQYGHVVGEILIGSANYDTWAYRIESLLGN